MFTTGYVKKNQKRLWMLGVALFMICGMALGYAVLSSSIKINGTGTISTNWDILFTNIEEKSSKGATTNHKEITDKLTATFDVDLESPGSYIEYRVTIKNNGNMDAVIAKVTGIVEANQAEPSGIRYGISGLRIGDDLLAGSETTFVVRAEMPSSVTALPQESKTLDLKVDVRQKEVDSSGLVTTLGECFQTNETGETITKYLCGKSNTNGYSEILDVNIPREINGVTITKIGSSAFSQIGLRSVIIPNTITTIGAHSFRGNGLKRLILPNSVKTIENNAFIENQLAEIDIPSSVTSIGTSAFRMNAMPIEKAFIYNRNSDGTENKSSLNSYAGAWKTKVVIPNNIEVIGESAFHNCGILEIELPDQLTTIKTSGLVGNKFSSIVFPTTLRSIGNYALNVATLSHVEFLGDVPQLGRGIFIYKGANTIKVPTGTLEQYKNINGTYSPSQTWFASDNENLLDAFYE